MLPGDDDRRKTTPISMPAWGPALAASLFIVAIGGMTTWFALQFDALRPRVGDMIVFAPNQSDGDPWQLQVPATAVEGRTATAGPCVLDPNEMSANGGSLIIESREESNPPRFQLHWAGHRTAKGGGDCGASVDLMLDRFDLQRLANSAGGFGVKPHVLE
jgi:hypothetical protein